MALFRRYEIEPIDASELPDWISDMYIGQYIQVATVTVFAYDIVTTMDKEVQYFWKGPWRSVHFVYFANRYIGLIGTFTYLFWNAYGVNLKTCNFSGWSGVIANSITIVLIDYILMIRVLALYSNNRLFSTCLKVLLLLEGIIRFGASFYVLIYEKIIVRDLARDVTTCDIGRNVMWYWGILEWTIPLAYAVILLFMVLCKAVPYWRSSAGFKGFKLVKVIVQDQVVYFSIVLVCSAAEMISYATQGSSEFLTTLLTSLGNPSFFCILGSHLLINLKETGQLGISQGTNYRPSDLNFVDGSVEASDNGV